MEIKCLKGERILLTDNCSQTFKGVVKSVNESLGRILLTDIVQLPEHKSISGYRNFDKGEIIDIKRIESDKTQDDLKNDEGTQESTPITKLSEVECERIKKLESEYCYIKDFGSNFHSAISLLKNCQVIGVYAKDTSKGRFERASVMAISTSCNIFIFDLHLLGDEVFQKGLKEILESSKIVKVVHDCRLLSDCLKHKHLINLENVRDVEAEDIMVVFQYRRNIRTHSRSLEYLTKLYLGVRGSRENGGEWSARPLNSNLLEHLVSSSALLIPLHQAIEQKYLQLLINASNLYNNHTRNCDLVDVLFDQPHKTLMKELREILVPQNQPRTNYRIKE